MKVLNYRKFIKVALINIAGMIFLMTISGCTGTEVIFRTGPDFDANEQDSRPHQKKGPPPWAPAHGYRAKHHYRYYPASQVYYNQNQGSYIYYSNGKWVISVSLPDRIKININNYVTLEMNTDQPYKYHTEVAKKYPPGQAKKNKKKKKGKGKNKW
jgi:hypothetical protein